jgi:hypothetical protein
VPHFGIVSFDARKVLERDWKLLKVLLKELRKEKVHVSVLACFAVEWRCNAEAVPPLL